MGLRACSTTPWPRPKRATAVRGIVFFYVGEIYGDPAAEAIPTPETYRGNVSCTGPRACYDEAKRFGETLCVTYAGAGVAVKMCARSTTTDRASRSATDASCRDFARDVLAAGTSVMLSDGSPTATSAIVPMRSPGTTRSWSAAAGEAYNIGIDAPEISVADVARAAWRRRRGSVVRLSRRGAARMSDEAAYLADNPNASLPGDRQGARRARLPPHVPSKRAYAARWFWYSHNRSARKRDADLRSSATGYVGLVTGACRRARHTVVCVDVDRTKV
jgi:dTDP-glucose 4,6-dehydratase/UDP-glucuronate decarboxylase